MGNCECVTSKANSHQFERRPFSPLRSHQEEEVHDEIAFDEQTGPQVMRQFRCHSLTGLKRNQMRFLLTSSSPLKEPQSIEELEPPEKANKVTASANDDSRTLQDMKIDAKIFINIKKGKVTENYEIESLLGEGTYGRVLLVTHKKTKLRRALKSSPRLNLVIKKENARKTNLSSVLDEFEILKQLDHPNIVRLYEMYLDEKNFYLISEYCEGGELFDRIKKAKFFNESTVAKLMFQILSAVTYCHSRNIVHRDLKPENILFVSKSNDDHLKLIDFGVSSNFNKNSRLSDKQGTVSTIHNK
jgi:calcium-dependent protein kinase